MIKPKVIDSKVVIGPCRLSYTHVFAKYDPENDDTKAKFQTAVLIPKSEKETIKAINEAMENAKKTGILAKWGGKLPKTLEALPLRDGDEKDDEAYEDHYFLNAKSATRPGIVDKNGAPIVDEEDIYSGVWAYVSITFFAYASNGKKGIACGLNNIKKFKDGERFGGRVSAEADFADIDDEDDDDL